MYMYLIGLPLLMHLFALHSLAIQYEWIQKSSNEGLTKNEKKFLLDVHNHYRSLAAKNGGLGYNSGMQKAANMRKLVWDDKLAEDAQRWAGKCTNVRGIKSMHNPPEENGYSGQNYMGYSDRPNIFEEAMKAWADNEEALYTWGSKEYVEHGAGHYTQILWARSYKIGCGFSMCKGYDFSRLVCHFMPGGNHADISIYESGEPCSKCDPGFGFCSNNLCAKSCQSSEQCRCTVNPTKCRKNGGNFDNVNCKCNCGVGKGGLNCEKKCEEDTSRCIFGRLDQYCKPRSKLHSQYEAFCPVTCLACQVECKDSRDDCREIGKRGNCIDTYGWMKANCQKTCNLCTGHGKCDKPNFDCKSTELKSKCRTQIDDEDCRYYYRCCLKIEDPNDKKNSGTREPCTTLMISSILLTVRFFR